MKYYTVHMPPVPSQDRLEQADEMIFVKEGFAWMAFYFLPLWMLANRLWIEFVAFLVVVTLWFRFSYFLGIDGTTTFLVYLIAQLYFGFEGNNLIRWRLAREDYKMIGTVSGSNREDCELKFFTYWLPENNKAAEKYIPGTPASTANLSDRNSNLL